MSWLSIQLLGAFSIQLDGAPLSRLHAVKARALLIYLITEDALEQRAVARRQTLRRLLWPNAAERSARQSLRSALHLLKKCLPPPAGIDAGISETFLLTDRESVSVNPALPYELDVADFAHLLQSCADHRHSAPQACPACLARLEEAAALYHADFLSDFSLSDSPAFEEWSATRRAQLRRQVLDALDILAEAALKERRWADSERWARRQLAIDDLRENAHRQLMESLFRSGRRSQALAQFERCRLRLTQALDIAPSVSTQALYERIRRTDMNASDTFQEHIHGYELREKLGSGAFSIVYLARQVAVDREVAIKIILPRYANHPEFIRRFEAEAQTVARLEHPHIVPLYDYWREPDRACLVMRRLRGGTLRMMLQQKALTLDHAAHLLEQIANALNAAHRQGVIHRDIKPANILLDEDENAYLSDFGIAKDIAIDSGLTASGAILASPAYAAPEQLRNEAVSARTDIYSLGIVLYEMLTGCHPFPDSSIAALINKHLNEPLPLLRERLPAVPPAVDAVIQTATAKNPLSRFSDSETLAAAFSAAAHGGPLTLPEVRAVAVPGATPRLPAALPQPLSLALINSVGDRLVSSEGILDRGTLEMALLNLDSIPNADGVIELLVCSAVAHQHSLVPLLDRFSADDRLFAALRACYDSRPTRVARSYILEALALAEGRAADQLLVQIATQDESPKLRSRAALLAAHRGYRDRVVNAALTDMKDRNSAAALEAFAVVGDVFGVPNVPYPRLRVFAAITDRRWRAGGAAVKHHMRRAMKGALAWLIFGAVTPFLMARAYPADYQENVTHVLLPAWMLLNSIMFALYGLLVYAAAGLATGIADTLWLGKAQHRNRIILTGSAGLVHGGLVALTQLLNETPPPAPAAIYVPATLLFGIVVGWSIALAIPRLGTTPGRSAQLLNIARGILLVGVITVPYLLIVYQWQGWTPFLYRFILPVLAPVAVGVAFLHPEQAQVAAGRDLDPQR